MRVINLLPKSEQKALAQENLFTYFKRFVMFSAGSYVLLILILLGWRIYLNSTYSDLDGDIKRSQALIDRQDNDAARKQIQKYNNTSTDYLSLAAASPKWSKVLESFSRMVPSDVLITSINANTKTGKIDIAGVGLTRDAVLALRSNIAASQLFKNVNLPLENLQKPSNVVFNYSFFVADGVLTK
jgi:Tfp pilus assembly protein PilN